MTFRRVLGHELRFVFPDNTLAYDCAQCGGKCCKHGDFHIAVERELVKIGRISAEVAPFLSSHRHPSTVSGDSFYPQCWFLGSAGDCALETKGGRDAKPLNCILFPTNVAHLVGDTLWIDVHMSCPLGLIGEQRTAVTHDGIAELVALAPDAKAVVGTVQPAPYASYNDDVSAYLANLPSWASLAPRVQALHRVFRTPPVTSLALDRAMSALAPSMAFSVLLPLRTPTREVFNAATRFCSDSLSALRFLAEAALQLKPDTMLTGMLGSLFTRERKLIEILSRSHCVLRVKDDAPAFNVPEHMVPWIERFTDSLDGSAQPLSEVVAGLQLPAHHVRGVLELVHQNWACFDIVAE